MSVPGVDLTLHEPRWRRVRPALPAARPAQGLRAHATLRLPRQSRSQGEAATRPGAHRYPSRHAPRERCDSDIAHRGRPAASRRSRPMPPVRARAHETRRTGTAELAAPTRHLWNASLPRSFADAASRARLRGRRLPALARLMPPTSAPLPSAERRGFESLRQEVPKGTRHGAGALAGPLRSRDYAHCSSWTPRTARESKSASASFISKAQSDGCQRSKGRVLLVHLEHAVSMATRAASRAARRIMMSLPFQVHSTRITLPNSTEHYL